MRIWALGFSRWTKRLTDWLRPPGSANERASSLLPDDMDGTPGDESNPLEQFVQTAGRLLGETGILSEFGVSRLLTLRLGGRWVELGTNGSFYWVKTDLSWESFPELGMMAWAPLESYARAKYLEGPPTEPDPATPTGDEDFDSRYLVLGQSASGLASTLPAQARRALIEQFDLQLEILGKDIPRNPDTPFRRVVLIAHPDLCAKDEEWSLFVKLGTRRFTPEACAAAATELARLAAILDPLMP